MGQIRISVTAGDAPKDNSYRIEEETDGSWKKQDANDAVDHIKNCLYEQILPAMPETAKYELQQNIVEYGDTLKERLVQNNKAPKNSALLKLPEPLPPQVSIRCTFDNTPAVKRPQTGLTEKQRRTLKEAKEVIATIKASENPGAAVTAIVEVVDSLIVNLAEQKRPATRERTLGTITLLTEFLRNPRARHTYDAAIGRSAQMWNVEPALIKALTVAESNLIANRISKKGAVGLMQLVPGEHPNLHKKERNGAISVRPIVLTDPDHNTSEGTYFLATLYEQFKHSRIENDLVQDVIQTLFPDDLSIQPWANALAAYNWGPGNFKNALVRKKKYPPETIHHVIRTLAMYAYYRDISRTAVASSESPRAPGKRSKA